MTEVVHAIGQFLAGVGVIVAFALLIAVLSQQWFWEMAFGLILIATLITAPFALYDLGGFVLHHVH